VTLVLADAMPAVARYAGRFHLVAGERHHIASPLGAWLLLALCGPASSGTARAELSEVLGCDVEQAAALAARLLSAPHPLVAAAAGFWRRDEVSTEALSRWLQTLPGQVETGRLTDQAVLDDWARRNTFGLITKFPVDLSPDVLLMLATALATKVSWQEPFDVVPAAALGPHSPWASELGQVLRTPRGRAHAQFIATTGEAGDVAVHTAWARDGLQVTSVAAQPGVPAGDVIAAAYRLAGIIATGGEVARRSLFTLPLGPAPLWEVTEQPMRTVAPDGREERCTAVLPAWSADSRHDLTGHASLGFPAAAAALAALLGLARFRFDACQAAVARYSRTGFEAAAVTGMAVATAMPVMRPGRLRTAELRFGRPFAVVAVTTGQDHGSGHGAGGHGAGGHGAGGHGPWHGLPVFSAWITRPEDAGEAAATG
jgi:hypothetical protein